MRPIDVPPAIAAVGGNCASQRILEGMGFEAEIDSGMGDGTSELGGQQWLVPHQVNAVAY
jgi:hypothetical protein